MKKSALIAMSGGVDSSVAAKIMSDRGFSCIGVTMKLYTNEEIGLSKEKTCCSADDIEDARNVAFKLKMPFYVFNFTADFEKDVIGRFVDLYERGATPNPCIDCNRYMKFEKLLERAIKVGMDYVVTGHYARVCYDKKTGRYLLKKAFDSSKDQSYVLYNLTQNQLSHTIFPLGELEKTKVREIAESAGFYNAKKRDSQDICFVPDGDYVSFIQKYTGRKYESGNFIDVSGKVIGSHKGIIKYTIGQRKGLGVSFNKPLYVCSKCVENNTVTLSEEKYLYSDELEACDINLIACDKIEGEIKVKAKIRYNQEEQPATVRQTGKDRLCIKFDEPQRAIAKGQAVVLYDNDTVIGGGTIC